jgi:hypothetical protein
MTKNHLSEDNPITDDEHKLINEIKFILGEKIKSISDLTILRFIRGFSHEENASKKSTNMITEFATFRENYKADELCNIKLSNEEEFKRQWICGIHGKSLTNHPVYIERPGQIDLNKIFKQFTIDDIITFHIQMMEKLTKFKDNLCDLSNKQIYKHIVIIDLKGLSMSHLSNKFREPMKRIVHIDQNYYPETLFCMIIVNASWIIKAAWEIISPLLDPLTKERIKFGEKYLEKYVSKNNLPKFLNGTCKCKECLVSEFIEGDQTFE